MVTRSTNSRTQSMGRAVAEAALFAALSLVASTGVLVLATWDLETVGLGAIVFLVVVAAGGVSALAGLAGPAWRLVGYCLPILAVLMFCLAVAAIAGSGDASAEFAGYTALAVAAGAVPGFLWVVRQCRRSGRRRVRRHR